jgi:SnoaL-like domain
MNATTVASAITAGIEPRWEVAGQFLDALARRDFPELESCLDTNVRFRALVPRGVLEANGAVQAVALFRKWFGQDHTFEVIDAAIGQVGERLYMRWQVRIGPFGDPSSFRLVEQHAFAAARERIEALDLLCSGFTPASPTR